MPFSEGLRLFEAAMCGRYSGRCDRKTSRSLLDLIEARVQSVLALQQDSLGRAAERMGAVIRVSKR